MKTETPLYYAKFYYALMKSALPPSAKVVLSALADLQRKGCPNPKIDTLARATGQSHPTVTRALRRLRESRLLEAVKGQHQNRYRLAPVEVWAGILLDQNDLAEANPARSKRSSAPDQNDLAEPPASLFTFQESSYKKRSIEKEGSREVTTKLSTRARENGKAAPPPAPVLDIVRAPQRPPDFDFAALFAEVREIYKRAGLPVAAKHEQLALQLLLSLDPETPSRAPERLPNFLMWSLASGRWDSPATTKSLLNVCGDWDVELTVRDLPDPRRKPSIGELKAQEYLRRHAKGNA